MMHRFLSRRVLSVTATMLLCLIVQSGEAATTPDATKQAFDAASAAAMQAMVKGPTKVAIHDQASIDLPAGYGFVPQKEATDLLKAMGNSAGDELSGLVVPMGSEDHSWFAVVTYSPSGYIKDEDAKNWKTDELLQSLKDGTESGNERRRDMGIPELEVTRWVQSPAYSAGPHQLVWSVEVKQKQGDNQDPGVNYNTYVLGREGYVSMNVITQASTVEHDKQAAQQLLQQIAFNKGKDYGSFNSSTDKVAEYGLAALIAGVAAKKLGLLALLGATIVKFAKVIFLSIVGILAAVRKWFKGKAAATDEAKP